MVEEKKETTTTETYKCQKIFDELLELIQEDAEWTSSIMAAFAFVLCYNGLIDHDQMMMLADRDFDLLEFVATFKPEDTETEKVGKA